MHARSPARRLGARLFCTGVLGLQLYFVVHAYGGDPLKRFGFQPFAESSIWRARIYSVDDQGRRRSIEQGFAGYHWDELVRARVGTPFQPRHASAGVDATLHYLQRALDYVADHTPRDRSTRYLEAEVDYVRNRRGLAHATLRSKRRALP